jgi:hypothetical protein
MHAVSEEPRKPLKKFVAGSTHLRVDGVDMKVDRVVQDGDAITVYVRSGFTGYAGSICD